MQRVRAGEVDAFDALVRRYWESVFLYARQFTGDEDQGHDVAQEAFARLWENRRRWESSRSVGGWLLRTARNFLISEQRKAKVRMRWRSEAAPDRGSRPSTPLQDAERQELRDAIEDAVQGLSPRRREVFVLFHLQHLSYQEIAEILDIRPRTIANHLQSAVSELRIVLERFIPRPPFSEEEEDLRALSARRPKSES